MTPEEFLKYREDGVAKIFDKVDKALDLLIEINQEYCSWDEWEKSKILDNAIGVLQSGFKKELEERYAK